MAARAQMKQVRLEEFNLKGTLSSAEVIYDHKVCPVWVSSLLLNIPKAMKRKITSAE